MKEQNDKKSEAKHATIYLKPIKTKFVHTFLTLVDL